MDITKKKVLLIPMDYVLTDGGGLTDFHVRREILDRIRSLNVTRVVIIYSNSEDKDFFAKVKAIEFFVFAYCKTAVSVALKGADMLDNIMSSLSYRLRSKEFCVCIGDKVDGVDDITMEDFLCTQ